MKRYPMAITETESISDTTAKRHSVLDMSAGQARQFFLKHESYTTIDLPPYINFDSLLRRVVATMEGKPPRSLWQKPDRCDGVNHVILDNKDGRYSWRPLELIHPALYVALAQQMTESAAWDLIRGRFRAFDASPKINCLSMPVEYVGKRKNKAAQIRQWWEGFEQRSLELSLDYQFVIKTDIVDCYAAIYTHSIAWGLHGKSVAKANPQDYSLIGNVIDRYIRDMHFGQTNGLPQGSELMNFIAEIVLGYADAELAEMIQRAGIEEYEILRYRDDYRIFVNSPQIGETILRLLTEVMFELGLKLGEAKTGISGDVILASIKSDKLDWLFRKQREGRLQQSLLIIHDHSIEHPNSGSVVVALQKFYGRLLKSRKFNDALPLIAIVTDIAYRNPRAYPVCAAILSKLIHPLGVTIDRQEIVAKIRGKFSLIPNTGHLDIWMQRIAYPFCPSMTFDEPICQLVSSGDRTIWNNDWISSTDLRNTLDEKLIVDRDKLKKLKPIVPIDEIALFGVAY